jgi:integrase/recombinase XerD
MTTTSRGHVLPDLEHWTASMEARHQSPRTIKRRTGTLNSFAEFIGRDARTATPDDVTLFLASDPGWSKATKAAYYSDLHAYWTWLILTDREDASPTAKVQRPRMPVGLPRPCDTRDLMRALAVATGDCRAMILLGCYGALRCSEIAAVRGEDFVAGLLWVPDGKGGDPAAVAAHPLLAEEAQRRPRRGPWFPGRPGGHVCSRTVANHVGVAFERVGAPDVRPHALRHWCASQMLAEGASTREVQVHLRHKSLASTEVYTRIQLGDVADRLTRLPLPAAA